MDQITKYIEELLAYTTLSGGWLSFVTMFALCAVTALVAWLVYMLCIKVVTPLLVRITKHTDMIWDDYLLNPQVLHSACHVVPAIVVWQMLPPLFIANHVIQTLASKATAIYITITVMRLAITFIGSFKLFDSEKDHRTAA